MVVLSGLAQKKTASQWTGGFVGILWAELSRSLPPGGRGNRRSQKRTGGSWFRILPQNHLRASEQCNHLAVRLIADHRVPDLGGPAEMDGGRPAADGAVARGTEEIA